MKPSVATTYSATNYRARVIGITFIVSALSLIYATVTFGEQPNDNKGYEQCVISCDEAVNQSKATGRPIKLVFTGSDWCTWCNRLAEEVFTTYEFAH
jgi:thioredoxin-related protein